MADFGETPLVPGAVAGSLGAERAATDGEHSSTNWPSCSATTTTSPLLITDLTDTPERYGGKKPAKDVRRVARARQHELRARAIRLGATLYAEKPEPFVARMEAYWDRTRRLGPEPIAPASPAVADEPSIADGPRPGRGDRTCGWRCADERTVDG